MKNYQQLGATLDISERQFQRWLNANDPRATTALKCEHIVNGELGGHIRDVLSCLHDMRTASNIERYDPAFAKWLEEASDRIRAWKNDLAVLRYAFEEKKRRGEMVPPKRPYNFDAEDLRIDRESFAKELAKIEACFARGEDPRELPEDDTSYHRQIILDPDLCVTD